MWTATFFAALLLLTTAHALLPRALGRRLFSVRGGLKMAAAGDFYSIVEKDGKGNDFSFEQLRGRVVYGVNVASKCGYTASGYALLEKISAMDGVSVLIAPCNQFGGQEPGSAAEIESFCALKGVKGATILEKADVNGAKTRPVYKYLKEKGVIAGDVAWNFAGAFIVDKAGNAFAVKDSKAVEKAITDLL